MEYSYKTKTAKHPHLGTGPIPIAPSIDPATFEAEREAVFRRCWINVGRVERIPEANDYFVRELEVCYTSILVVRGKDEVVRAFHNMCSHRGNPIAWDKQGKCNGTLACRFHGWVFDTAGKLVRMSDEANFFDLDKKKLGLSPIHTEIWKGFIYIHLADKPEQSLLEFLGPVADALDTYPFEQLTKREWYSCHETVNWKVLLDAQLEGWHVPFLHAKSLAKTTGVAGILLRHTTLDALGPHGIVGTDPPPAYSPSPLDEISLEYGIGVFDAFAFGEPRHTDKALYKLKGAMNLYFIFPNVIMGLMHDCYWMYNIWPVAVDRSIWEIAANTLPPRNAGEWFSQEYNKVGLRDTLMEDAATHEKIQKVLRSGAMNHFHFQDEELVLRNFHHAVDECLAKEDKNNT
ncbi:MAG: phenylpropionate dioxygenase-like ring-hydroxylating dioxygenase large terminal subunit [Gammaproteobacteria bacterium]|jgi:phenylpropionate dioxygenase-like ring-hydroxylating dioxygenase large terminal subunit